MDSDYSTCTLPVLNFEHSAHKYENMVLYMKIFSHSCLSGMYEKCLKSQTPASL
jgi:hypothetical protein